MSTAIYLGQFVAREIPYDELDDDMKAAYARGLRFGAFTNEKGEDWYQLRNSYDWQKDDLLIGVDPDIAHVDWATKTPLEWTGVDTVKVYLVRGETGDENSYRRKWFDADTVTFSERARIPEVVSDRQFFQQLAIEGEISEDEAIGAVATGTLPQSLEEGITALPAAQQFAAKMMLKGATTFERKHPMTAVLAQIMGWDDAKLDSLWIAAAQL